MDVLTDRIKHLIDEARSLVRVSGGRINAGPRGEEVLDEIKTIVVHYYSRDYMGYVYNWIHTFLRDARRAADLLNAGGWLLPKEFKSFISGPESHLRKKLFQYTIDLVRGKLTIEEYLSKSRSAITTSIRTNMRSLYQSWVFSAILVNLASMGARIIYPEHGYILIERTGRQRSGGIPPNLILKMHGGEVSFFLEAPRPVGWGDSKDLRRAWSLYTSLRPDMLVYGGRVMDIVDLEGGGPPIKRPNIIIECKELDEWYNRVRYLRGPLARPLTAEEWFSRWLDGLMDGLAEVLNIGRSSVHPLLSKKASVRVREYQLVRLYKETFRPDKMILVSRVTIPDGIRSSLESDGITIVDGVEMGDAGSLSMVAKAIREYVTPVDGESLIIDEVLRLIESRGITVDRRLLSKAIRKVLYDRIDEVIKAIEEYR